MKESNSGLLAFIYGGHPAYVGNGKFHIGCKQCQQRLPTEKYDIEPATITISKPSRYEVKVKRK